MGSRWRTSLSISIDLGGGLSHRERVLLFNAGRRCEVYKLLTGGIDFDYALAGADEA